MDRVHRLGQEHPVTVTRFIVKGTVEQRMLSLQESKRAEAQAVLGGADGEPGAGDGALDGGGGGGGSSARERREAREKARKLRLSDLQHYFS